MHALISFLSLLLGRALLRRARERTPYRGTLGNLIQQLSPIRTVTVTERQEAAGVLESTNRWKNPTPS